MPEKTFVTLRRADRAVGGAFALLFMFAAGAAAIVPHTDHLQKPAVARVPEIAPLPLKLVPEKVVEPIVNPGSVVVPFVPVEIKVSLEQLVMGRIEAEQRCLAEAMYYEARGEGVDGQMAIAEVVYHRVKTAGYPHSICGVVYQGADVGHGCQFSFACDGALLQPKAWGAWARAKRLAARIVGGIVQLGDETEDAISFHAVDVQPEWADRLVRTIQIGNHIFYRAAHTRSS